MSVDILAILIFNSWNDRFSYKEFAEEVEKMKMSRALHRIWAVIFLGLPLYTGLVQKVLAQAISDPEANFEFL